MDTFIRAVYLQFKPPLDAEWTKRNAAEARQQAEELLDPGELVESSGEVVWTHMSDTERPWIVNTLRHPNSISVDAENSG